MTTNSMEQALEVTVTVAEQDGVPQVICTPELLVVASSNALIVFGLDAPGYAFPTVGAIKFQNPGAEFPNSWFLDSQYVAVRDRRLTSGQYAYTATVTHEASGRQYSVDPIIENGVQDN